MLSEADWDEPELQGLMADFLVGVEGGGQAAGGFLTLTGAPISAFWCALVRTSRIQMGYFK